MFTLFELRGICKNFDAVVALNNASLKITPGKITALLGSNGSGKSTMIKVLAGLVKPNNGEITFDGKPVQINAGNDAIKLGISTAFQDLSLIPTMTILDNIVLGMEPVTKQGFLDKKKALDEVLKLLDRFNIKCNPFDYVQTLPTSTQSMLEIAKAVYQKPRLLLLDEVTASLHKEETDTLFSILRELKSEGVAMVYVTHRMNEIFEICDDVTIMRSGKTVIEAPLSELTMDDIVYYMTGQRPDTKEKETTAEDNHAENREIILDVEHISIDPKVKDISFKAHKGEIVGIGGLEGQGQPEFIRAIMGDVKFECKSFKYKGKEIRFKSPADAVKNGIGFISGERNREAMFSERTIAENIFAGNAAKGKLFRYLSSIKVRQFAQAAVKKYNIKIGKLKDPANSLSGGNQQKLVVARWIAMNPSLLLLDDPTKGVDIHSRHDIQDILRQCAKDGMTIIISASDTDELLEISDRIYVFYEGKVSAELSGKDKNAERLVAAMVGMSSQSLQEKEID